ncbi:MAG: Type 1 glutamine amidotransferase-like domain-containing protein [bacterium]|nr:Type 1 glutamine amidotransferase-like domain-containing protein [bacterium]
MKLLLTANGVSNPELEQAFLELTGNRKGLKIAFITTAGDNIEWIPEKEGSKKFIPKLKELTAEELKKKESWLSEYKSKFEEKGHNVVFVDLKDDSAKIQQILEAVDVIDVGGGDINWLLDWAKKSKLDTYLKDILMKDALYMGASAGSMLVNPDIGFTWWEPGSFDNRVGLGIVNFMFQPLHGGNDVSKAKEFTERKKHLQSLVDYPWKIYLVMDDQAVKVDGDKIEHIGLGIKESI